MKPVRTLILAAGMALLSWPALAQDAKVLTSANARYVMGQLGAAARNTFMLDTQTGRVWVLLQSTEGLLELHAVKYNLTPGSKPGVGVSAPIDEAEEFKVVMAYFSMQASGSQSSPAKAGGAAVAPAAAPKASPAPKR